MATLVAKVAIQKGLILQRTRCERPNWGGTRSELTNALYGLGFSSQPGLVAGFAGTWLIPGQHTLGES